MRVLPTRAVSLNSGLPTRNLLHRMRDFSEGEDKLQCLLLALVLLGRASLGSADGLLDALQRALRPMCLEGLARDVHAIACHVALQCSSCGEEAYALLSLRAAIVARRQLDGRGQRAVMDDSGDRTHDIKRCATHDTR